MLDFDIIVIGKGLVGAAAAKHLSGSNKRVAVIGSDEPNENESSLVYASHYDEARVQRIMGKDEVWTRLNFDSVLQYESIQMESGIEFHKGVGCLYVNPYGQDDYINSFSTVAQNYNIAYSVFEPTKDNQFEKFNFPKQSHGVVEAYPSGYINPRLLIKAQLELFKRQGGTIFSDTVINLSVMENDKFLLETERAKTFSATQVLVATGSFINQFNILPQKLKLITKSEVVLLVKIEEKSLNQYNSLPSLLYEIDEDQVEGIYLIPPVKYPDGNYYLKIGANSPDDLYFDNLAQIQEWFRNGKSEKYAPALCKAIKKLLPSLNIENMLTKKCVISRTATGRPYIGETSIKNLYLAGGCNGYSAMCSEAIGGVVASFIINDKFPDNYPRNAFTIEYMEEAKSSCF
jgi:glycine/D-amino acid oxidase-like deaminating enzyme